MPHADVLHRLARTLKGELCLDRHPQLPVRSELGDRVEPGAVDCGGEVLELDSVTGRRCPADDEDTAAAIADQPEHLVAYLVYGPVEEHIEPVRDGLRSCSTKPGSW